MNAGYHVRLTRYPNITGRVDYFLAPSNKIIFGAPPDERIVTFATLDREFSLVPCERACVTWDEGTPKVTFLRTDRIEEVPSES